MRLTAHRRRGGRAVVWLIAGLALGGAAGAGTMYLLDRGKAGIPGGPRLGEAKELALVPADAAGFVHVRARDIWKSPHLAEFRKAVDRAGPDALKSLDAGFVPAPSTLDRLTVVFFGGERRPPAGPPGGGLLPPGFDLPFDAPDIGDAVAVLAFDAPYSADAVRRTYLPGVDEPTAVDGKKVWVDRAADLGLYFPSDTVLVLGPAGGVQRFARGSRDGGADGPLTPALKAAAAGGRHLVGGLNVKALNIPEPKFGPGADPDIQSLEKEIKALLKAESVAVGVAFGDEATKLDIRAGYKTAGEAAEATAAVRGIAAVLRKKLDGPRAQVRAMIDGRPGAPRPRPIRDLPEAVMGLMGTGALNILDDYLADPPVKAEGNELVATFEQTGAGGAVVGTAAVGVGLLLPAVQKVREAAGRVQGSNNLKQMALGVHNYHDTYMRLPIAGYAVLPKPVPVRTEGPGLSWRVHILPFVEQENLYRQFKLNEPWDSPHNAKLIPQMPKLYVCPTAPAEPGKTYYKTFVGGNTPLTPGSPFTMLHTIQDGTSNTIMIVEGGAPVVWTKPDDIPFTPGKLDPQALYLNGNPRVNVALFDATTRQLDLTRLSRETLNRAVTPAAGDILGNDW
ncbi:MAG: hypothetical protein C0501_03200 [Isosphaera sp.]|nr:hypothetical protein [Isosphaera sp.]